MPDSPALPVCAGLRLHSWAVPQALQAWPLPPALVLPALMPRTLCAVPRRPLPVFLEAPPSCLLPAVLPPSFRFPEPSPSAPDRANLTSPELHAACSTNPECRFSSLVLGFSRNPALVLVILFNQFLQKRQDLLFLPFAADLPAPYRSDTCLLITVTHEFRQTASPALLHSAL